MRGAYPFRYDHLIGQEFNELKAFFRKFHQRFEYRSPRRPFLGHNPSYPDLVFDSLFEGGNLDLAVRVTPTEYDLFMRVDSNTRGHLQWYNFTIRSHKKQALLLNICNFSKGKSLYERGMKPFIHSSRNPGHWHQPDFPITY
jgi:hypothetical protein